MLSKWCENTSLNGINELYYTKDKKPYFVFWSCVMLIMFAFTVYLTFLNISSFINSPTVTTIETIREYKFDTPEVLLCYKGGHNVARMKSFNLSDDLIAVLERGYFDQEPGVNYTSTANEFFQFISDQKINVGEFYKNIAAHDCQDIVLTRIKAGQINLTNSKCSNVSVFVSRTTAPCLLMKNNGYQTSSNAIDNGIKLTLQSPNGTQISKLRHFGLMNSFTLVVNKKFIVQDDNVIEVPLGYKLTILLSLTRFIRLQSSGCLMNKDFTNVAACDRLAVSNETIKNCNCAFPGTIYEQTHKGVNVCNIFDFKEICLQKWSYLLEEAIIDIPRKCMPLCEELLYGMSVSMAPLMASNVSEVSIGYSFMQHTKV